MAILVAGLIYLTAAVSAFPRWTIDDAFITYRYAENLALHGELTWNVGDVPVEGYTGVLLPLVLAGGARLGFDADVVSKTIGVASLVASAALVFLVLFQLGIPFVLRSLSLLLYLSTPVLYPHAWSGLETMLFAALLSLSLFALVTAITARRPRPSHFVFLCSGLLLVALCRPEGLAFAAIASAALAISLRSRGLPLQRFVAHAVVLLLIPLSFWLAWRIAYYGHPLPNTYYAKARSTLQPKSLAAMVSFARTYLVLPIGATLAAMVTAVWRAGLRSAASQARRLANRPTPVVIVAMLAFVLAAAGQYAFTNLRMNWSYRFFVPCMPFAACLFGMATASALSPVRPRARRLAVGLLLGVVLVQFAANVASYPAEVESASRYDQLIRNVHVPIGQSLAAVLPRDVRLAVVIDAGAMPYYSKLRTLDFGGLNDEFLARRRHRSISKADQAAYFFAFDPGIIVVTSRRPDGLEPKRMRRFGFLLTDERFGAYELVASVASPFQNYYELVFIRRDLVRADVAAQMPAPPVAYSSSSR